MVDELSVSVDVVLLRYDSVERRLRCGFWLREWEPYLGELALPGVRLTAGERLTDAARRAVAKTGVGAFSGVGQLATFDEPFRDPRGPTLSVALWAVTTEVANADWGYYAEPPALAFDHNRIVDQTRPLLGRLLWRDEVFTRALTGEQFSVTDALAITSDLQGRAPDRGNLNRMMASLPGLIREPGVRSGAPGRPGAMWSWVEG